MDHTCYLFRYRARPSVCLSAFLTSMSFALPSLAEEPRLAGEPFLLAEPAEITQVVDAFDEDDPFDLNLTIGYQYSHQGGDIARESSTTGKTYHFARYTENTHRLLTRADIGIYRDIALVIRLPIILANERKLEGTGSAKNQADGSTGAALDGSTPLFGLPFHAPTRSGIEYLAVGLDFGILNQYRDASSPTWVFGFEGRFDVSSPMHACNDTPPTGALKCADPSDNDRDGNYDASSPVEFENRSLRNLKEGVSRGTTGLEIHTYISKRIKYVEPYGGLKFLAEFPTADSDFHTIDFSSSLVNSPPLEGTVLIGMAVIPWEVRSAHQRATLDFRLATTYRSEGRDYSELFDALGSSSAPSLRSPLWSSYQASSNQTSVIDTSSKRVYFNGLTDVQQHLKNRVSAEFTWQAAKYVKLGVGVGYTFIQSHFLTDDQACNANLASDSGKAGPCRKATTTASGTASDSEYTITGVPNPNYRPTINAVGSRYRVDNSSLIDGWLNATVLF
jgi:hypothetical protein